MNYDILDYLNYFDKNSHSYMRTAEGSDYKFSLDVPGYSSEEIDLSCSSRVLTLKINPNKENLRKGYSVSYPLPTGLNTDAVTAELKNGVLSVVIPRNPSSLSKKIVVKTA